MIDLKTLKKYNRNKAFDKYSRNAFTLKKLENGCKIVLIPLIYTEKKTQVFYYKAFKIDKKGYIIEEITENLKYYKLKFYKKLESFAIKVTYIVELKSAILSGALNYE